VKESVLTGQSGGGRARSISPARCQKEFAMKNLMFSFVVGETAAIAIEYGLIAAASRSRSSRS
jgi:hypothetical protein